MDTQAERRNEVIGVAKDYLGAKTAGEFAGSVADKMAEGGSEDVHAGHQTHYQLKRYSV